MVLKKIIWVSALSAFMAGCTDGTPGSSVAPSDLRVVGDDAGDESGIDTNDVNSTEVGEGLSNSDENSSDDGNNSSGSSNDTGSAGDANDGSSGNDNDGSNSGADNGDDNNGSDAVDGDDVADFLNGGSGTSDGAGDDSSGNGSAGNSSGNDDTTGAEGGADDSDSAVDDAILLVDGSNSENGDAVVCIDTPPVGDGWGWDGSQSCRVGSGSDASELINLLGFLKIYPDTAQADFSRAVFGQSPGSFTLEEIRNFYVPTSDTCQVATVDSGNNNEPQFQVLDQRLNLISSGETVVVSSNAGTFATLNRVDGSTGPTYRTDIALNVDTPGGLTVDVLGDAFPAFSNVQISDVPGLQIANPAEGQNIDAYNFFTWNGNDDSLSVVEVYTGGVGADNQEIIVGCTAVDDGAFVFPESVRAQMGSNFDDNWTVYLRIVYTISQDGDAVFVTANSVFGSR